MSTQVRTWIGKHLITEKSFYKKALLLTLPIMLQSLINQGVNMMDTIMVGSLGEVAISASSLANQFYQIFQYLCLGIGGAGVVLASQHWGADNRQTVKQVYNLCLQIVLVLGAGFAVLSFLFPAQIMSVFTYEPEVIVEGAKYLRVTAFIFLPHGLALVMANIVRSIGNTQLGLWVAALAFVINIGANYVFIFGKLGAPAMGVMGAAVGTLCARLVEFAVCVFYLLKMEKKLAYRFSGILKPPSLTMIKEFRRYGLPVVISDTILGLSSGVISMILGHMGKEVTSAYSIVVVLDRACSVVTMGTANAAGIMVGQTVGKGDIPRAKKEGETFFAISVAMGLLGGLLVATIGVLSIGLYNISASTYSITLSMMYASAIAMFFRTIQNYLGKGVLRGAGDTKFLMVADVLFQWCASIPLGYIFGILLQAPPFWVLLCIQIDYIIKAVWFAFRLYGGKWVHKVDSTSKT